MTKAQLKNEVNKRVETLRSFVSQVQKIENYKYDRECQNFFPRVTSAIKSMNNTLNQLCNLDDAEFNAYDTSKFLKDIDSTVSVLESAFKHIKSRGPFFRETPGDLITHHRGNKLPKSYQNMLTKDDSEPGMA